MTKEAGDRERVVSPPGDSDPSVPNRVVSVVLQPGERVRWEWATLPDGRRFVSGYTILPAWRAARRSPQGNA